jgi:DNA-binding winged helix-turn-helix (wHTH) protein/TolB-like protein
VTYRFGTFEFRPDTLLLTRQGSDVRLEPQPAKALALLLARAGEVVSREELRAAIWPPDTHVDFDRGLAYCLNQLRAALGDRAENPRFVETLPRRGVRFIAPVAVTPPAPAPAGPPRAGNLSLASVARSGHRAESRRVRLLVAAVAAVVAIAAAVWWFVPGSTDDVLVAVSVFDNETGDARYDRPVSLIGDSVVERLVGSPARLAVVGNMPSVRVPRNERDLSRIHLETGAAFVVLGQLQRRGDRLSLFLQLIRFSDGAHVWVDRIERPADDALAGIETDAASRVEAALASAVGRPANGS